MACSIELKQHSWTCVGCISGVSSSYSSFVDVDASTDNILSAPLVLASPIHGNTMSLNNASKGNTENIYEGSIVLFERGKVQFSQKIFLAQKFGAVGVIIGNNDTIAPNATFTLCGVPDTVPSILISRNSFVELKSLLANQHVEIASGNYQQVMVKVEPVGKLKLDRLEAFELGCLIRNLCAQNDHQRLSELLLYGGARGGKSVEKTITIVGLANHWKRKIRQAIDEVDGDRQLTPLMISIERQHIKCAKLLIEFGANTNILRRDGFTALHIISDLPVTSSPFNRVAKLIFNEFESEKTQSIITKQPTINNSSSFSSSLSSPSFSLQPVSLSSYFMLNIPHVPLGWTPLHFACKNGNVKLIGCLLKQQRCNGVGAAIDLCSCDGNSPLMVAARWSQIQAMHYLIKYSFLSDFSPLTTINITDQYSWNTIQFDRLNASGYNVVDIFMKYGNKMNNVFEVESDIQDRLDSAIRKRGNTLSRVNINIENYALFTESHYCGYDILVFLKDFVNLLNVDSRMNHSSINNISMSSSSSSPSGATVNNSHNNNMNSMTVARTPVSDEAPPHKVIGGTTLSVVLQLRKTLDLMLESTEDGEGKEGKEGRSVMKTSTKCTIVENEMKQSAIHRFGPLELDLHRCRQHLNLSHLSDDINENNSSSSLSPSFPHTTTTTDTDQSSSKELSSPVIQMKNVFIRWLELNPNLIYTQGLHNIVVMLVALYPNSPLCMVVEPPNNEQATEASCCTKTLITENESRAAHILNMIVHYFIPFHYCIIDDNNSTAVIRNSEATMGHHFSSFHRGSMLRPLVHMFTFNDHMELLVKTLLYMDPLLYYCFAMLGIHPTMIFPQALVTFFSDCESIGSIPLMKIWQFICSECSMKVHAGDSILRNFDENNDNIPSALICSVVHISILQTLLRESMIKLTILSLKENRATSSSTHSSRVNQRRLPTTIESFVSEALRAERNKRLLLVSLCQGQSQGQHHQLMFHDQQHHGVCWNGAEDGDVNVNSDALMLISEMNNQNNTTATVVGDGYDGDGDSGGYHRLSVAKLETIEDVAPVLLRARKSLQMIRNSEMQCLPNSFLMSSHVQNKVNEATDGVIDDDQKNDSRIVYGYEWEVNILHSDITQDDVDRALLEFYCRIDGLDLSLSGGGDRNISANRSSTTTTTATTDVIRKEVAVDVIPVLLIVLNCEMDDKVIQIRNSGKKVFFTKNPRNEPSNSGSSGGCFTYEVVVISLLEIYSELQYCSDKRYSHVYCNSNHPQTESQRNDNNGRKEQSSHVEDGDEPRNGKDGCSFDSSVGVTFTLQPMPLEGVNLEHLRGRSIITCTSNGDSSTSADCDSGGKDSLRLKRHGLDLLSEVHGGVSVALAHMLHCCGYSLVTAMRQ